MNTEAIKRGIMRNAAKFEHPVFGVHIEEATREVFIFDSMSADLQTPASCVRYMLDGDPDEPGEEFVKLRPWHEGDPSSAVDEPDEEEQS